ncbi:unnamed protein product [Rhodiola kirilowii]
MVRAARHNGIKVRQVLVQCFVPGLLEVDDLLADFKLEGWWGKLLIVPRLCTIIRRHGAP